MKRSAHLWIFLLGLFSLVALATFLLRRDEPQVQARLAAAGVPGSIAADPSGFSRADSPRAIRFPDDHGAHPDFQTEWWYFTGNLQAADGRWFGYQLTFFRRALLPPAERVERASDWATGQVYMAHFALADAAEQRFQAFERLSRGAVGLAGAQATPFAVWLEDWRVETDAQGRYHLTAAQQGVTLDLLLIDRKGPVLQGDQGYSRKGSEPGNASYYYSLTRLESAGTVEVEGQSLPVSGLSWMDHEWSTSALSAGQVGWDWFSLQLDDGSELMVFQLRRQDGSSDTYSAGAYIAPDGRVTPLGRDDFIIQALDTWKSRRSGATYPAGWRLEVPVLGLKLEIEPRLADQELDVSYRYWEGAVAARGARAGRQVSAGGYVELTGYAGSMSGEF